MNNNQLLLTARPLATATFAAALALTGAATCMAQTSEYFLHSGDQDRFTVVQNGAILRTWGLASGTDRYQYPMVVRDTVRTMGADVGDVGADYDFDGNDLGPRYTHPAGTSRCWDGTADEEHNYSIDTAGVVWQFDLDWSNPVRMFTAGGIGALAYDSDNDSIWVGTFSGSDLTQYDKQGNILSSFTTGHTKNMALAIDPADGTLWLHDRNRQGTLEQWSRSGQLLATVVVPDLETQNALSGEFRFAGGAEYTCSLDGQCPGTVRVAWSNAPANTQQGIVFARNTGNFTIPGGPCQGTQLGLGTNQLQLVNTIGTGNGSGAVNGQAGAGACGGYVQLVAIGTPCQTSNVVQLP